MKEPARSFKWPALRRKFLSANPRCVVCGSKKKLEAHHIVPFHIHPPLELDAKNLIALCENKIDGINCHLFIGHLGNFKGWNPEVRRDAVVWADKIARNKLRFERKKR